MSVLRIFSYLPNPRVWKATIAARICGVEVDIVGARPRELANWLWDFDARALDAAERTPDNPNARNARRGFSGCLYKTESFLRTQPFGTVPAAFSPDGKVGIFESNSILRAVARAGEGLYGRNGYEASRIDGFLDAGLTFAREAQVYLLALQNDTLSAETYERMAAAFEFFLAGVDAALGNDPYLCGEDLSIADIAFVCDLAQFRRERFFLPQLTARDLQPISGPDFHQHYPAAAQHFEHLSSQPAFAEDLSDYVT